MEKLDEEELLNEKFIITMGKLKRLFNLVTGGTLSADKKDKLVAKLDETIPGNDDDSIFGTALGITDESDIARFIIDHFEITDPDELIAKIKLIGRQYKEGGINKIIKKLLKKKG